MNNAALRAFIKSQTKQIYETHISGHNKIVEAEEDVDNSEQQATDITALSKDDGSENKSDSSGGDEEKDSVYTYKSMITLFNAIRSGQSMKDKNVVASLKELWDTFDEHHQKDLLSTLAKTAKIVSKSEEDSSDESDEKPSVTADDIAAKKSEASGEEEAVVSDDGSEEEL